MGATEPLVLVVDDEATVRQALERALRFEGFAVSTAAGGHEALAAVAERPPAVVVLDVTMPDLDGVSVVRPMRADGLDVPVGMLSARDEVSARVAGLQAGADDYLVKQRIRALREGHCGLVRAENPCRCRRRIGTAVATGRVDPDDLLFARAGAVGRGITEMERLAVLRSHPETRAPDALARRVLDILTGDRLSLLDDRCSPRGNAPIESA